MDAAYEKKPLLADKNSLIFEIFSPAIYVGN